MLVTLLLLRRRRGRDLTPSLLGGRPGGGHMLLLLLLLLLRVRIQWCDPGMVVVVVVVVQIQTLCPCWPGGVQALVCLPCCCIVQALQGLQQTQHIRACCCCRCCCQQRQLKTESTCSAGGIHASCILTSPGG
jgi:hypothetical protein